MNFSDKDWMTCLGFPESLEHYLGSSAPPIYETAPFYFKDYGSFAEAARHERDFNFYWRGTNPTLAIAERMLAELEEGENCKCFASGMAAIAAALMSCLSAGDHAVLVGHVYESTVDLTAYLSKFGVSHTLVQSTTITEIKAAIRPNTRVLYLESPSSLLFRLVDLEAAAELAKSRGITTIIDNTWATPLYQKPLRYGIDLVVHAGSKYLGGHNDLVAGAVIGSKKRMERLFYQEYELAGACLGPFEAWLLIRSLRTLPLRMKAHEENGLKLASYLNNHPAVSAVHHPGLSSHPDYELGKKQMTGCSGLFGFELKTGGYEGITAFINRLKHFRIGVSWGSYESQIVSPNYGDNEVQLKSQGVPVSLIRLGAGVEPAELLIADLEQALRQ